MPKRNPDQGVLPGRVAEAQKLVSGLVARWLDLMSVVPDLSLIAPSYLFWVRLEAHITNSSLQGFGKIWQR